MEDDYAERARVFGMAMTRLTEDDLAPWLALHRDEQDEFSGEKGSRTIASIHGRPSRAGETRVAGAFGAIPCSDGTAVRRMVENPAAWSPRTGL